jgi:hypothetical protein
VAIIFKEVVIDLLKDINNPWMYAAGFWMILMVFVCLTKTPNELLIQLIENRKNK